MISSDSENKACSANTGCACSTADPVPMTVAPAVDASDAAWVMFRIPTMDCAVEEGEIRRALEAVSGIKGLRFQLQARTVGIQAPPQVIEVALESIQKAGFAPVSLQASADASQPVPTLSSGWVRLLGALVLATGVEVLDIWSPQGLLWHGVGMVLAVVAIALAGFDTYQKGVMALRAGKLNINALMTVAVTGACLIGQWPEAAMVMALYAVAEWIEARSVDRARHAIQGLLDLSPKEATVRQADGQWAQLPSAEIGVGAIVRIRPGERVPLDGVVIEGNSAVNQAPVTGESIPVDKMAGDRVFAGTVNQSGELLFRTTALASDTTLAHIIEAVEHAQGNRAPTQRFVDRFAAIYTPAVFVIALAVAIVSPMLMNWGWMQGIYKGLVLLVIACPCALVISTPVTVVSALASAARRGILIKGGTYLEQARKLRVVAMDKTGTLTQGKPRLVEWSPLPADDHEARPWVAQMAASLAVRSDHPVSQAIAAGLETPMLEVQSFQALPGHGVQGHSNGQGYVLGNHRLIEARGQCSPYLESVLDAHQQAGRTVTVLASDEGVLGVFAVADTLKPEARDVVADLQGRGIQTVLLSGDNEQVVRLVAEQAGIKEARGHLLPQDKLTALRELRQAHGPVAMVGDGVNDAPALAQADMGIAMGAVGTDTAMEAADVVIMNDDLRRIPELIALSNRTHQVLWQNIVLALGIKLVFLILAVFGHATMWMAVFADMGASLLVVANGLRLLSGVPQRV
ncbi:MAG: heavy metal translocating P-type ATPase [Burkholderiales bacterium]|nr:heavy metal translocating P-type ATPase [Burkholderiales bacterium]